MKTLSGKTILFCRSRDDSRDYESLFRTAGASTVFLPTFAIEIDTDSHDLRDIFVPDIFERLDWLLFSSPNGVDAFHAALRTRGFSNNLLRNVRCGVVGEKAADRLTEIFPNLAVAASAGSLQQLLDAIRETDPRPLVRVLHPTSVQSLQKIALSVPEGMDLQRVAFYRTVAAHPSPHVETAKTPCDVIVFSSPTSFDYFIEGYGNTISLSEVRIAAFGNTTAAHIREKGYRVDIIPDSPKPAALLAAIEAALGADKSGGNDKQQITRKHLEKQDYHE